MLNERIRSHLFCLTCFLFLTIGIGKIPTHPHTEIGCIARNVNEKTGSQKLRLPNAVFAHGAVKLHADIEIYNSAVTIHKEQVQKANAAFRSSSKRYFYNIDENAGGYFDWEKSSSTVFNKKNSHGNSREDGEEDERKIEDVHNHFVRTIRNADFSRTVCHHDLDAN